VLISASGGPERELTEISRPESAPSSVILFGHDLAWSPDSRFLVVPSGDPPKEPFGLLLVSSESGATRRLLAAPPGTGPYLAPAVSPDGRHLAFVRRTDFAVSEIWMNTLSGDFTPQGEPIRMTYGNRLTTSPVWAGPRELLFLSGEVGAEAGLYRMSIGQPGTPRPMPSLGEGAALLSVLPGSGSLSWPRLRLAFTRVVKDHNIYRTESNGPSTQFSASRPFSSSTRIDFNPQFSPDGRRITFESTRSGSMEVWVANEDGSSPRQLTDFGGPLTGAARWSPDGRQIVFNSRFGGQADLYIVSANGGGLRRLTFEPSNEDLASWSGDGRWLYFHSDRNGSSQIWRMPADGGEWIPVTTLGGLAALESIDRKFVYYTKGKALGPASLWRVAKDGAGGGGEVPVLDSLADWSTFSVAPDGIYFIPYAGSEAGSSINFYRFADGQTRAIIEIHKPVSVGLTVSPDGRVILYTQVDRDDNDLVIARMLR
jgi:Tol biopolymer transport system component